MRRRLRARNKGDAPLPAGSDARQDVDWQERAQFFVMASTLMRRRIRASHARAELAAKLASAEIIEDMDTLDELLTRLESLDPRQAQIVEMHCFGGLTIEQTAQALGISDDAVKREWTHARAWLRLELSHRPS